MQRTSSKARTVVGRWHLQVHSNGAEYFSFHALHTKQWRQQHQKWWMSMSTEDKISF